jgi:hypothetical protein
MKKSANKAGTRIKRYKLTIRSETVALLTLAQFDKVVGGRISASCEVNGCQSLDPC